jgi:hypothetical protein
VPIHKSQADTAAALAWEPLLSHERNLKIGRAVLFRIETAAIDIARAPEQQVAPQIDEIVLHKFDPSLRPNGAKVFRKMLWGAPTAHVAYTAVATLFSTSANPWANGSPRSSRQRRSDLLRSRRDRMRALPDHMAADLDPRERQRSVRVRRVDDFKLEAVGWQKFE